ncbi:MAG: DUF4384 domain-containing protein [Leptospiraceae bacterium]|nr:DUF4384 domain-containing protein [Leptospiraceae bacterium]MCP5512417.1 DUF4384 domain-containing protein [Leptospiraceae bacterium]
MKRLMILILFFFTIYCSGAQRAASNEHSVYKTPIKGFTQFDIYKSSETELETLLGYDESLGYKVCDGKIGGEEKVENQIEITLNSENENKLGVSLPSVFKAELENKNISAINLKLINPAEIRLLNPRPSYEAFNNKDMMQKECIGSVLRVDRIDMDIVTKEGIKVSGEAVVKKYEVGGDVSFSNDSNSAYFAKNAYIGYKKVTDRIDNLAPIVFDYQILHLEKGSKKWKLLQDKDTIQSGDYIKIRMKSNYPVYVYLLNIDGQNNVFALHPDPKNNFKNPLIENKWVEFPGDTKGFEVDNTKGLEELQFYVFRSDSKSLNDLVEKVQLGKIKARSEYDKQEVVHKTKGIGKVAQTKVSSGTTAGNTDLPINEIRGLASDYKQSIIYNHQ